MNKKGKKAFLKEFSSRENFSRGTLDEDVIYNRTFSDTDPDWKIAFYKESLKNAESDGDYMIIAASIAEQLNDKKWAKEVYQIAIDAVNAEDPLDSGYTDISISIIQHLQDRKWGVETFQKGITDIVPTGHLCDIGEQIFKETGNKELLKKVYKQSLKNAKWYLDYTTIARGVVKNLKDKAWAKEIYEQTFSFLAKPLEERQLYSQSKFYCLVAEDIIENIKDFDLAKEAYQYAIDKMNKSDYKAAGDKTDDYPTIDQSIKAQIWGRIYKTYKAFHKLCSDKEIAIYKRIFAPLIGLLLILLILPILVLPFFGIYWLINYFCDRSVGWIEAILFFVGYIIFVEVWGNLRPWLKLNSLRKELKNKRKENLLEDKSKR